MTTSYTPFDAAEYLDSVETITEFLVAAAEDENPDVLRSAIDAVARARLSYNGYTATMEYDGNDHIFVGRLVGIRDRVVFHGETVAEFEAAFRQSVDAYIANCAALGRDMEKLIAAAPGTDRDPTPEESAAWAGAFVSHSLPELRAELAKRRAGFTDKLA
jgi:hypothetical protein